SKVPLTNTKTVATGTDAIVRSQVDYRTFVAPVSGLYTFEATTPDPASALDPVIGVFTGAGQLVAWNNDGAVTNTDSRVTAAVTAGERYYFAVTNLTGSLGGKYAWTVTTAGTDDALEENDTAARARKLGKVSGLATVPDLVMRDRADWFKFAFTGLADASSAVTINFARAAGDLDLQLFDATGNLVRSSTGTGDAESVSLESLVGNTFYVHVYGYNGATNPDYELSINVSASPVPAGSRVLYLNTEGASLSRAVLERYAGTDWAGFVGQLDAEGDGVRVGKFLVNRPDRNAIIARVIELLQADVERYGIVVKRHTGGAVENQGATTVFLGPSTLSNNLYHVASDTDRGNNNRTDVAFVGDEDWGPAADTALAVADVVLHEAGHTWGLWNVASGSDPEAMGLRLNTPEPFWVQNTGFRDVTYARFPGDGPGTQNSHQTMRQTFGLVAAPKQVSFTVDTSVDGVLAITTVGAADRIDVRRRAGGAVEVRVNGRAYRVVEGLREVRINTGNDARDRITVAADLGGVVVTVDANYAAS
ncbi:MAG TPA: hypothetical protein VM597_37150, partial [Gemmataceae bacterium]|nr:hypothetical protein [Gemmataceae bacterium]